MSSLSGTHPLSLEGRVAVVIGGTSGIGRAIGLGLAEAGADVVCSGRRAKMVEEIATLVEAVGRRTLRQTADVCRREELECLRDRVHRELGPVDILVNSSGTLQRIETLRQSESDWQSVLDTNLTGTLRSCQVFGASMMERGYGRIVNIASLNAFVALTEVAAYAASKAGVVSLTRSLAVEWARHGVVVNAIAPGVFPTDLNAELLEGTARGRELRMRIPMGRFGEAREVVGAAVFLASQAASYVTGQTLVVDGGFLASGVNQ